MGSVVPTSLREIISVHDKNNSRNKGFYDAVDDNTPGNSEFRIPELVTFANVALINWLEQNYR